VSGDRKLNNTNQKGIPMNKCEHCDDHGRVQVIFAGEYMGKTRIVRRTAKLEDYRYKYLSTT